MILFYWLSPFSATAQQDRMYERDTMLMGSTFQIKLVAKDSIQANEHIDAAISEIVRIE
jgi:thiamine biosynthesis lipoprotein